MNVNDRASRAANPEMYVGEMPRPKRAGRSLAFAAKVLGAAMGRRPDLSVRSVQDLLYADLARDAMRVTGGATIDQRFAWLFAANGVTPRSAVLLAELGRFRQPHLIRRYALWVCETKGNVKLAVARLRQWRCPNDLRMANSRDLANQLVRVMNLYAAARPRCTPKLVRRALALAEASCDAWKLIMERAAETQVPEDPTHAGGTTAAER